MNTYKETVQAYLKSCKRNQLSDGTIELYERILRMFSDSMKKHRHKEASIRAVEDFANDMSDK